VLARLRLPGRYRRGRGRPDPALGPGAVEIAADLVTRLALAFPGRAIRLVLARRPGTARGYDLALVTTDLHASPADLLTGYAARWAIEQAFADARNVLSAGEARNRTPRAVTRTVPFALITSTLGVTW
jgi:hypothetical protein